jgi:hypothetical protein
MIFQLLEKKKVSKLHPKCSNLHISHLCLADDLLMFSSAHVKCITVIVEVLHQFKRLTGLKTNVQKRAISYVGGSNAVMSQISRIIQFKESLLPVR